MIGRFEGRACLVTGSTGIAAAAARALHAEGARVFVVSRTQAHIDELLADLPGAAGMAADLADEEQVESAVTACVEAFGRLDCVYNVAGISGRRFGDGALHEMTLAGWQTVMASNATSAFLVCRAAIRQMLAQEPAANDQRGVILNMSSAVARSPSPIFFGTHGYAASKGAVEALSLGIAAYYAPQRIRINVIAPALVATPMSLRAQSDEPTLAYAATKQPLSGGILAPEDLVGTALYLLGDDSRMVTGQIINVDAGWAISEGGASD